MNENERLIGESPEFSALLEQASTVAPLHKPVLVVGERGTGKEGIASRLHFLSNRWEGQFIKLNCAAISDSLLESELFGHEAGAFTGANKVHHGRFERAHGGTLFLDELANTSVLVQEKILRVIEYGEFERVGGSKTIKCDVRLVAATNEDLPELARQGKFRADLLDRLAFDVLTIPPLRHRTDDILLLAEHFAITMTKELERAVFPGFSPEAQKTLQEYPWPGNVRELKNAVERAVYRMTEDKAISEITLDPFASPYRPTKKTQKDKNVGDTTAPLTFPINLKQDTREREIQIIEASLEAAKYNQRDAADNLQLTYHQLRGYLKKYGLVGERGAEQETPDD
ncbi:MAG: phage shock protein operon transcriptional activator [Gammaproteobacteria bacterium]|nr:phage shock protein operon transcriptional activator [Gammaproteobacteria bacterium]